MVFGITGKTSSNGVPTNGGGRGSSRIPLDKMEVPYELFNMVYNGNICIMRVMQNDNYRETCNIPS